MDPGSAAGAGDAGGPGTRQGGRATRGAIGAVGAGEVPAAGDADAGWSGADSGGGGRESAPLAAAGALAYALLEGLTVGRGTADAVLQAVAVVAAAGLAGSVPRVARGHPVAVDRLARRLLTAAFTAICCQPLSLAGGLTGAPGHGPYRVGYLLLLLALAALCDAVLAAVSGRAATGGPYAVLLADELRALPGLGAAVGVTGLVTALAVSVAGLWALPVVCVSLLLTQYSCRRYADVRATHRQTIASLARATEIAGYTPAGHAQAVAALSAAVGRELGLSGRELTVLEHAALMHDIGQLSLVDPVPAGATEQLPAAEQRRIALLGGAVVRQTGAPVQVAVIVERQAAPYREQPLPARIVRVANAYTELAGPGGHPGAALRALERLRLATARDFDPAVVAALARVLVRGAGRG
ncbi:metal-dependent phosphohydrolase [Streptomyces albus subsp. albus]|nr:metal-dependent phosphohydrolase [Streptomyces albus subsp. albus]